MERVLLLEAVALLGIARLTTLILPFKWIAGSLGRHMIETDAQMSVRESQSARLVGQAVVSASRYTPWESVCLAQAVAGQWMLKRRGIAGTLYLGVAKDETRPKKLTAHAWLRCGSMIVIGRESHRQFTVVAAFGSPLTSGTSAGEAAPLER